METYFDRVMGNASSSFITEFETAWRQSTTSYKLPYAQSVQLASGSRLRPLLLAWGFYFDGSTLGNRDCALQLAVSIEMIHKASILIDDLIDNDCARHGHPAFHIEFSEEEAVLYAIHLLGESLSGVAECCERFPNEKQRLNSCMRILSTVISRMSFGALRELTMDKLTVFNFGQIKEIAEHETTELIENSYYFGYLLSKKATDGADKHVHSFGRECGYVFQALNDLEPFSNSEKNSAYKGDVNFDFDKARKNLVVAMLYGAANTKDRTSLSSVSASFDGVMGLLDKYSIRHLMLQDVSSHIGRILRSIESLNKQHQTSYFDELREFLYLMLRGCFDKLGISLEQGMFKQ